jgi:hypothetical protein
MLARGEATAARTELFKDNPYQNDTPRFDGFAALRRYIVSKCIFIPFQTGIVLILRDLGSGRSRIVMRDKTNTAVLVNHFIMPGMELSESGGPGVLSYSTINYTESDEGQEEILFFTFQSDQDRAKFRATYEESIRANVAIYEAGTAASA